jgi:hypothetical protein
MLRILRFIIFFLIFIVHYAYCSDVFTIPQPDRIGGTVKIGDQMLTSENDHGFKFIVSREDGTLFSPSAELLDGLNNYNWYLIDIPIKEEPDQPNGATPGETVRINVYKNKTKLIVLSPKNGQFTVDSSGSTRQLNLELRTPDPELIIKKNQLDFGEQALKTLSTPLTLSIQNVTTSKKLINEVKIYGDFFISNDNCGTSINAKNSCQIAIQFSPKTLGSHSGELLIQSDSVESPQKITLSGNGITRKGDINGDTQINLVDLIVTLQICNGLIPNTPIFVKADVNNDDKIAIEEAIHILYFILGQR